MDLKIWSKTLLSMYKYMDIISETIDELVRRETIGSYRYCGFGDTMNAFSRVINLTDRKRKLINLKVICDDVVSKINPDYRDFIYAYYFDNYSYLDVCEMLGISVRTFYRMKNTCIQKFEKALKMNGYNEVTLESMYGDEQWLMNALRYNEDRTLNERAVSYKVLKCVSQDFG